MISWKDVKQLLAYRNGNTWVSTLSLNIDGHRFPKRKEFMVVFKNLVKQKRAELDQTALAPEVRQSIEEDFEKMEAYLDQLDRNHHRGILIYSCSQKGLWLPLLFPVPLQSKMTVLPHPYTLPLTALLDQFPKYAVVLVSQERARIFEVYLGEITEHSEIYDEIPGKVHDPSSKEYKSMDEYGLAERRIERRGRRSDSPAGGGNSESGVYGLAERKIERHVENHVRHHYKRIAETTFTFFKDHQFDWLILGGQEENRASFEEVLHHDLKERIIARIKSDPKSSLPSVYEESLAKIREVEWDRKDALVKRIIEANRPLGRGVLGLRPTLHALAQGVVQTLVVQGGAERPGARCRSCGNLNEGGATCPECGSQTDPVPDLLEEIIEKAIAQSAQIVHLSNHPILEQLGGVGALLRYQPAKNTNIAKGAA